MAHARGFFRLIRVRGTTTSLTSIIQTPKFSLSVTFEPLKSLIRIFDPPSGRCTRPLIINWKLHGQSYLHMTKSDTSGHESNMGRLLGVSCCTRIFLAPATICTLYGWICQLSACS
ncbi:hypothetical protein R6Q59_035018 [Mikania micrantha]